MEFPLDDGDDDITASSLRFMPTQIPFHCPALRFPGMTIVSGGVEKHFRSQDLVPRNLRVSRAVAKLYRLFTWTPPNLQKPYSILYLWGA